MFSCLMYECFPGIRGSQGLGILCVFIPHAGVSWLEKDCRGTVHCITIECTCKLPVTVAAVTELGDQLAVDLEDEDAAGLVVDHDDVAVFVH